MGWCANPLATTPASHMDSSLSTGLPYAESTGWRGQTQGPSVCRAGSQAGRSSEWLIEPAAAGPGGLGKKQVFIRRDLAQPEMDRGHAHWPH